MHPKHLFRVCGAAVAVFAALPSAAFATSGLTVTGINNNGVLVGTRDTPTGAHGFTYSGGTFSNIDAPGAFGHTLATAINNSGEVLGGTIVGGYPRFLYSGGVFTPVVIPGVSHPDVTALNDTGGLVGSYYDYSISARRGFVESGGLVTIVDGPGGTSLTEINGINDAGDFVGTYYDGTIQQGFIDIGGVFTTLHNPQAVHGLVIRDINNSGEVVGYYSDNTSSHSFLYSNGVFTNIDVPFHNVTLTLAQGLNDAGDVAGYFFAGGTYGFVYSGGKYTRIQQPHIPGVPEPSSWTLMILGLGLAGGGLRRRRAPRRRAPGSLSALI